MTGPRSSLPRDLHPGAWWLWGLGMATAASRTTDPLLLALLLAVVALVVARRRTDAPWARGFGAYVLLGLWVIGIRVVFRLLLGGQDSGTILFTLPEVPLPAAAQGIRLGGPVALQGVLAAVYDGLRLATMLVCIGAINTLANPKRLLRSLPGALYEVGTAVVVSLSVAGQMVESARRVRRARRLRGATAQGLRALPAVAVPVLEAAMERSLALAAAMDTRGYGRTGLVPDRTRRFGAVLTLGGALAVTVGSYGLLDDTTPAVMGPPVLALGVVAALAGLQVGGRAVTRSTHRPDPWALPEWGVAACGVAVAVALSWIDRVDPVLINPSLTRPTWPVLVPVPALAVLVGGLAGWVAPPVPRHHRPGATPGTTR